MKQVLSLILLLWSLSSFARDKSGCDSLSDQSLAASGAFENVTHLDSLLEVDMQRLAACGSWDLVDQQIMNKDYLRGIISASLKDNGEFPTYGEVLDIFEQVKKSELYHSVRVSKTTFDMISEKIVDWDNLEYDKIKTILITEEAFSKFQDFLGQNKFAGDISYSELLEQYYEMTP